LDRREVDAIFSEVLDVPAERRSERLDVLCAGDAELRREVEGLLEAAGRPLSGVDTGLEAFRNDYWRAVAGRDHEGDEEDLSGQLFGVWRLEAQVGRGGLATVYLARREDGEFNQRAAFKVLRRGLDTDDLIARFRAEREILATLNHPGIAGILDGGTLPDGRPYLVLEFVDGTSITDYVREKELGSRGRLSLLREVAEALQHAHQHLVVHRDVKPSNVMVTSEGAVRLLDFGIARILDPTQSALAARLTRTGISVLTPAYGSPEQVAGAPVTTGSDVYQLGLLMAEVLTGRAPQMRPDEAPTPDTTGITDRDLLAIIQKATREHVAERYASVAELGADIDRYLAERPVLARPDSWGYRASKLIRRRPWLLPVVGTFVVTIAAYVVTITLYSQQVARERTISQKTQDFMINLFRSPDPRAPADPERGRSITVVEALDIGRARILPELSGQPALQASLSRAISSVYEGLDQFAPAIELREQALQLEEGLYGSDSSEALESMRVLARLNRESGHMDRAAELTRRQLEIAQSLSDPGRELGLAEHAAGLQAADVGEDEAAATLLSDAIDDLLAEPGTDSVDADKLRAIMDSAATEGATLDAVRSAESLALTALGEDTVSGLVARIQAAATLTSLGEYQEAETRYLDAIPRLQEKLGARDPSVLNARNNLAILYSAWERYDEAETIQRTVLEANLDVYGPVSRAVGDSYQNLATVIARQGRYDEALALHGKAFDVYAQVFDASHYQTALPLLSEAYIQLAQHRAPEAEQSASDALERLERALPQSHLAGVARCLLGKARYEQGDESGLEMLTEARLLMARGPVPKPYAELCGMGPA
jgi:serine/threonine-protein kinase